MSVALDPQSQQARALRRANLEREFKAQLEALPRHGTLKDQAARTFETLCAAIIQHHPVFLKRLLLSNLKDKKTSVQTFNLLANRILGIPSSEKDSGPKVLVQIGARVGDVSVEVIEQPFKSAPIAIPASPAPELTEDTVIRLKDSAKADSSR